MGKKLYEMTLEELWRLFPVFLTEHKSCWADWYGEEVARLKGILPPETVYYHVGSTAINGIMAKPIIDIIIAVNSKEAIGRTAEIMQAHGYLIMSSGGNRASLNKGYTENGYEEKVFHFHIRLHGDTDEIFFRDYLNAHPAVAREYERLKLRLWKEFEFNRDAYTDAKTEFVKKYTNSAKRESFGTD